MKKNKSFLFILLMLFSIVLFGCGPKIEVPTDKQEDSIEKIHEWVENTVDTTIADNAVLPTTCPEYENSVITWDSEDESIITSEGQVVSRKTRNKSVSFDYTIEYKNASATYTIEFTVSRLSLDQVVEKFEESIPNILFRDINLISNYAEGIISVTWASSNTAILSSDGVYIKPISDTEIVIDYIITDGTSTKTGSKTVTARGKTFLDCANEYFDGVQRNMLNDKYVTENLNFPTTDESGNLELIWESSDQNIITNQGVIKRGLFDQYVELHLTVKKGDSVAKKSYVCMVAKKDISTMTDEQKLEEFINYIAQPETKKIVFSTYGNITQSYGFIHFYENKESNITEELIDPTHTWNRPGDANNVKYITVHDTANNNSSATAKMHSNYVRNLGSDVSTSWHYVVGTDGIYRQIPESEIAYHAGDGGRGFALVDTGIKATAKMPNIEINEKGYYTINGVETRLRPYLSNGTVDTKTYTTEHINDLGVLCEIGANGNYYMGKTYFNSTYNRIANYGGNRNSIGIESCVNSGADYATTVRMLAKLVAELAVRHNVDITMVKGHHYFSGKPCPNAMLKDHYWYKFLNLVSLEKFAMENLSQYTFEWKSNSSVLNDTGKISLNAKENDVVNYSVTVKKNAQVVYTHSFSTTLKK